MQKRLRCSSVLLFSLLAVNKALFDTHLFVDCSACSRPSLLVRVTFIWWIFENLSCNVPPPKLPRVSVR